MQKDPIGLMDSGVGGLTVLKEGQRLMPNANTVFLGDQARLPYGPRSVAEECSLSLSLPQCPQPLPAQQHKVKGGSDPSWKSKGHKRVAALPAPQRDLHAALNQHVPVSQSLKSYRITFSLLIFCIKAAQPKLAVL